jgi:hypothetical protein
MLPFGPPFQLKDIEVVTKQYGIRKEVLLGMSSQIHWELGELVRNLMGTEK